MSPAEALLTLVQQKAAEVAYWDLRVRELADEDRAGMLVTKKEEGFNSLGQVDVETRQPVANVVLQLLHEAQRDLASFAAAAERAGVTETLVQLTMRQADWFVPLAVLLVERARRDVLVDSFELIEAVLGEVH